MLTKNGVSLRNLTTCLEFSLWILLPGFIRTKSNFIGGLPYICVREVSLTLFSSHSKTGISRGFKSYCHP